MTRNHLPTSAVSHAATNTAAAQGEGGGVHQHIVPGGHGHAFSVQKGTSFRIVDIHGRQIVDMMAWVTPYKPGGEHLSMSYSRYLLGGNIPPAVGESLVTNKQEPIFRLTADQCHTHDMTFMACNC